MMARKLCLNILVVYFVLFAFGVGVCSAQSAPIIIITIDGTINPATDDFLKSSLEEAERQNARLLIVRLNTPGGLLTSTQTMVESLLDAKVPVAVYVSPSGGGAISAGVFITLAGHIAAMAPGTTIGAAHPVTGSGQDVQGDMREKVENFAVSHIRAIAEQRGRNVEWAEDAVRESVAITDREALDEKVIDIIASDIDKLLVEIEGRTVTVSGKPVTLEGLAGAERRTVEMSFRQQIVNILADPNIAILLGLAAIVGIAIEFYNPGLILPGVAGAICLVLSLASAQVLPINYAGVALLALALLFFIVEVFIPSFGIWGGAGVICLVLGSIYLVDQDMAWGGDGLAVDYLLVGSIAAILGLMVMAVAFLSVNAHRRKIATGKEGLIGQIAIVKVGFEKKGPEASGRVTVMGELWRARIVGEHLPAVGDSVKVVSVESGMMLLVEVAGQ